MALKSFRWFTRLFLALSLLVLVGFQSRVVSAPAHRDADLLQLPTLLTSQVLDAAGLPDPNSQVVAFALPDTTGVADGTALPLSVVTSALTGTSGSALLSALPATVLNLLNNGTLNLEVVATSGGKDMVTFTSLDVPSLLSNWTLAGTPGDSPSPSIKFDFSTGSIAVSPAPQTEDGSTADAVTYHDDPTPVTTDLSSLLAQLLPITGQLSPSASSDGETIAMTLASAGIPGCTVYPGTIYYNNTERFLTANTWSGIPVTVSEGASSTHTLGVAVSQSGGAYSANGTGSISRSSSASVSVTYSTSHTTYNRVNYRHYADSCTGRQWKGPYSFYDFLTSDGTSVSEAYYYNCGAHAAGTTWDTGTAKSATLGAGVNLAGLSLSAQSGYSSSVNIHYAFHTSGEVCGNNTAGPLNSSLVEADIG